MRRIPRMVPIVAAGLLTLAACVDEGGQAIPGGSPSPSVTPSGASGTTANGAGEFAQIDACDLLSDAKAVSISKGLASEDLGAIAGATSVCEWATSIDRGIHPDEGITFGIWIRPSQSVDEVSVRGAAKVTDGDVAGRQAKLVAENDGGKGSCMLSFAAEDGRVDIIAESYDTERSCAAADKVSTIIEPKLPKA